jgi:ParB-like nuclease family protein
MLHEIDLDKLVVDHDDSEDSESLDQLVVSIRKSGLKVPVLVDANDNRVIDGARRIAAMRILGHSKIMAQYTTDFTLAIENLKKAMAGGGRKSPVRNFRLYRAISGIANDWVASKRSEYQRGVSKADRMAKEKSAPYSWNVLFCEAMNIKMSSIDNFRSFAIAVEPFQLVSPTHKAAAQEMLDVVDAGIVGSDGPLKICLNHLHSSPETVAKAMQQWRRRVDSRRRNMATRNHEIAQSYVLSPTMTQLNNAVSSLEGLLAGMGIMTGDGLTEAEKIQTYKRLSKAARLLGQIRRNFRSYDRGDEE